MKSRGRRGRRNTRLPHEVRQKIVAAVENGTPHRRRKRLIEQFANTTAGLNPRSDKIASRDIQGLYAIRLATGKKRMDHLAHMLDFPHVVKAKRGLSQGIGTLEVKQLVHEARRIPSRLLRSALSGRS